MNKYSAFDCWLVILVVILIIINWLGKFFSNAIVATVLTFIMAYIDLVKYLISEDKKLIKIILLIIMTICAIYYLFEDKLPFLKTGVMYKFTFFIYLVVSLMTPCLWFYLILKIFLLIYYGIMNKIKGNDNNE